MSVAGILLAVCAVGAVAHGPSQEESLGVGEIRVAMEGRAQVLAEPSEGLRSGDWVTVKYAVSGEPRADDWVAAYAPLPANLSSTIPVKFQNATVDPGYLSTGTGTMRLRLINVRSPYTFVLMRGGLASPVAVAASNAVAFADYNEITQVHTMITPRSGELRVQWVMRDALPGCAVRYGAGASAQLDRSAAATATRYSASDLCGGVATAVGWRDPGAQYHAILTGLAPGGRVSYTIDCAGGPSLGATIDAAVPVGANSSASVALAVFGDMGTAQPDGSGDLGKLAEPPSLNTSARIEERMGQLQAVMHIGDISYARGYSVHWDEFGDQVQRVASRVPWQQGIGNHERDFPGSGSLFEGTDSGGECGVPYATRFTNPRTESAADEPWYSWDLGPIHFAVMSTEHNFTAGSPQWRWILQDLAAVDRARTPWLVFAGHRPMYIDSTFGDDLAVAASLRAEVEPLLVKHRVDLALWGHHHSYQRTCRVVNETCVAPSGAAGPYAAPVHLVVGMAGMRLSQDVKPVRPAWAEYVNVDEWGLGVMTADAEALRVQFVLNVDGQVADDLLLTRPTDARGGQGPA